MITIKSGRHPVVVTLLIFSVASGIGNLAFYNQAATTTVRSMPSPLGYVYYAGIILGASVTLAGIFWRGLTGPLLERSGWFMSAGLFVSYGAIAIAISGPRALFTACILFGFAFGSGARIVQIGRELKKVTAAASLSNSGNQLEE